MSKIHDLSRRLNRIHLAMQPPALYDCRGARDELIARVLRYATPEQRARMNEPHELSEEKQRAFAGLKQMLAEMGREREKEAAAYRMKRR